LKSHQNKIQKGGVEDFGLDDRRDLENLEMEEKGKKPRDVMTQRSF
jgi:hypothetical protein